MHTVPLSWLQPQSVSSPSCNSDVSDDVIVLMRCIKENSNINYISTPDSQHNSPGSSTKPTKLKLLCVCVCVCVHLVGGVPHVYSVFYLFSHSKTIND